MHSSFDRALCTVLLPLTISTFCISIRSNSVRTKDIRYLITWLNIFLCAATLRPLSLAPEANVPMDVALLNPSQPSHDLLATTRAEAHDFHPRHQMLKTPTKSPAPAKPTCGLLRRLTYFQPLCRRDTSCRGP